VGIPHIRDGAYQAVVAVGFSAFSLLRINHRNQAGLHQATAYERNVIKNRDVQRIAILAQGRGDEAKIPSFQTLRV
jgi:hypothetical protein